MERYYSLNRFLRERFGEKVYKLALDGGMTCPNRDGTLDTRGCIFCSAGGSGEFAEKACGSITEQLHRAKQRIQAKTHARKFIAYFQSYTNTYAPVSRLEQLFAEVMAQEDVVALSVATRPDCLGSEVMELLTRLNRIKPVWVELGLQTIHPETAAYIRRGYDLEVYDAAVTGLKAAGISVITHVILGLPGETREMMLETVAYLSGDNRPEGIKLQLLHVLEGTDLAADYRAGKFRTMDFEEYLDVLFACIRCLPEDVVIHRLTGDGAKKDLLAPLWTGDKKRVMNAIAREMERQDVRQGTQCNTRQRF